MTNTSHTPERPAPDEMDRRRAAPPVPVYDAGVLPRAPLELYQKAREGAASVSRTIVPPREGRAVRVPAGSILRIEVVEGSQVGDLNLWNLHDPSERLFTGKTRALHGTHVGVGDRLWSCLPHMRPMATIIHDTLDWYGYDADGTGVHDVIGTRCDPYTEAMLTGRSYHHCCHSNLARAFAEATGRTVEEAETHVHDVLNVFMCTGFAHDTHRYVMKASPARKGDRIELFAEIDLLAALSACPGGDCGAVHSSDEAQCFPLLMEVLEPAESALEGWAPPQRSRYRKAGA